MDPLGNFNSQIIIMLAHHKMIYGNVERNVYRIIVGVQMYFFCGAVTLLNHPLISNSRILIFHGLGRGRPQNLMPQKLLTIIWYCS